MKKNLIGQQKHINKLPNYIYMTTNYIDKKNLEAEQARNA